MFTHSFCGAIQGIDAHVIHVEVDVCDGLPMFSLVGLLSSETREAKDRVRISMRNSGYKIPIKHITVNLSPADIRKEGTAFDLSIAMALMAAFGYIPADCLESVVFVGELSLDGSIKGVTGVLPIACMAREKGFEYCIVPKENEGEAAVVKGVRILGVSTLKDVVDFFVGTGKQPYTAPNIVIKPDMKEELPDFDEIAGQESAKRALEIAVAGMHNVLLIGPPGAGKTMLAQRIPSIMPELTFEETLEISKVYSVLGMLDRDVPFVRHRPFRNPHHSITATSLIGGGYSARPGEICMADCGVLFLDELPEFNRNTIEMLRQPLEEHKVTISRLHGTYTYPAKFMLIAAMNPCKCGYYPDRNRCNCSETQVRNYLGKISMPILDRIDLCVEASPMKYQDLSGDKRGEKSEIIRKRVAEARKIQSERYKGENIRYNGELSAKQVEKNCVLGEKEKKLMERVFEKLELTARAYHRILKVARTIADLDGEEEMKEKHLNEAIYYRGLDKKYWGNTEWN